MISNTKGWKKNRINDESMENWSALHINGRKVHYREQSLVVATAKIIIMSALGPTLAWPLVTQPMLQLRPNCTELRSMDYYQQIFCRFQKCKQKVPPPSLLSSDFEKSCFFSKILVMIFFQNWHFWTLDGIFEIKMIKKICLDVIRFGIGGLRKKLG